MAVEEDDARGELESRTAATPPALGSQLQSSSLTLTSEKRDGFPAFLKGKRVLLATESLGPVNGVSRTTLMLIEHLRKNGVQLAIVAPHSRQSRLKPATGAGLTEFRLPGYELPYNPDLTVVYPFQLDEVYKHTFKPDIVYLASPASTGFQMLFQIRQLQDPPVVLLNFQTDLSAYSEILFPGPVARFSVWLLGVVQGFLFNHRSVHTIFYPSSGVRRYLEKAGAPGNKMVRLGRGVDTSLFDPSRRDDGYRKELAPNGEMILVCVCRLAPEKGFEFLAQVAMRLARDGFPFKLLIVGGNMSAEVEDEVHHLFDDVKDHVVFTGFRTGVDLARAYATGDVFLHCSITETFGLVVLEAMASGLPVIARDEGGPSDIILHGETGYLVPPHDLEQYIALIKGLRSDKDLHSDMAVAARRYTCDVTWEKINQRVAWQMTDGLRQHLQRKQRRRPIRNFIVARYQGVRDGLVIPAIVQIRLYLAAMVVYIIWFMTAFVLLCYGHRVFSRAAQLLRNPPLVLQRLQYRALPALKHGIKETLKGLTSG
ncbi:glycosyl transferase [Cladophialophora carrionii]|uniref:Glycosyl transferase n=1 Tax=Cladophialophora carrionii TaxID=86049 RepID=A0A1C1CBA9_9EURO|nr:glycosyl transferase [Cladophialophora carrionii]